MENKKFAHFWIRHLAYFIDAFIYSFVWLFLPVVFYAIWFSTVISAILQIIASFLYFILFHYYKGQTIWKMALWIKVVDKDWNKLSFLQCVWRSLATIISFIPLLIWFFWSWRNKEWKTFHDMLSWTRVISIHHVPWWVVFLWNFIIFLISFWILLVIWLWVYMAFQLPGLLENSDLMRSVDIQTLLENSQNWELDSLFMDELDIDFQIEAFEKILEESNLNLEENSLNKEEE